ncbi:MAG: hypothetical protein WAX85_00830 [Minisyncoccia bacterium]
MQQIIEFYKHSESLHHAYLFIVYEIDESISKLKHFFEEIVGIKTSGNPDFWHGKFKTLSIDEARAIIESSARKNFSGAKDAKKIFIIETDFITEEAQSALLKAFEEPTPGTHFFIVSPQDTLLPTLRSRMQVVNDFPPEHSGDNETFKVSATTGLILSMRLKERLAKVKEITDAISDEESTKQDAIAFLNQIEKELYEKGVDKSSGALKVCEEARASLYDRGAPMKIILENVMLSI